MANMYDQAAQAQFLNTYVPIDFNNLYRIGKEQANMVQEAAENFTTNLQKLGEFRSPSTVDTQKYYDITLNSAPIQSIINEAVSNPDAMKDPAFRARMNAVLNGLDYSSISLLKESADNLRAGLQMRAKMRAEGTYNPEWDDSDIPNYDTLGTGNVFSDITPIKWMNANQLSDMYFNDLEPSSLGSVMKNGILYDRAGITYNTLHDIAAARFNDLVATPQGQKYYEQFLRANNNNANAAREAFIGMIADSQRDRIRNIDTINPVFLANIKAAASSRRPGGSGDPIADATILRRDTWRAKQNEHISSLIGNRLNSGQLDKDIADRINRGDTDADSELATIQNSYINRAVVSRQLDAVNKMLRQNPTDPQLLKLQQELEIQYLNEDNTVNMVGTSSLVRNEFERLYSKSADNINTKDRNYSADKFVDAQNKALDYVSHQNDIFNGTEGDPALMAGNVRFTKVTSKGGQEISVYTDTDSSPYMLNEEVFEAITGSGNRDVYRKAAGMRWLSGVAPVPAIINAALPYSFKEDPFGLKTAMGTGKFTDVEFLPSDRSIDYGDGTFIKGKLRIRRSDIEDQLGTGTNLFQNKFISRQSTADILKKEYGANKVVQMNGDEEEEFYEIPVYKYLPLYNTNYNNQINPRFPHDVGAGTTSSAAALNEQFSRYGR